MPTILNVASGPRVIEAERRTALARVQLVRFDFTRPSDDIFAEQEDIHLDYCLTPRPSEARACFRNRWHPSRFERLGSLFMVPAGEPMHARSDGIGTQMSVVCELHPEAISEWFEGSLKWTASRLESVLDIRGARLRGLLLRFVDEMRTPGFASDALLELMTAELAIELGRFCAAIREPVMRGGLPAWCLRAIDERAREGGKAPTLDELAGLCRTSVRQLTRGFRASRGCSIGAYLERCRIEHARRLLASGGSVKASAYALGFSTPSAFSHAFSRFTGETPSQYRRRVGH